MKVKKHTEITIIMSEEEAAWLKAVMQNSLSEDESDRDKGIRKMFWDILNQEGVK